jgi:hypothetical protein
MEGMTKLSAPVLRMASQVLHILYMGSPLKIGLFHTKNRLTPWILMVKQEWS